jgi:hypothetical protein
MKETEIKVKLHNNQNQLLQQDREIEVPHQLGAEELAWLEAEDKSRKENINKEKTKKI